MTDKAAISAVFVDYRRVKGRKCHQLVFEIASEAWPEAYKVLGEPTIETSDWFAIARMNAPSKENKGGQYAQAAAILCDQPAFRDWLSVKTPAEAAECIRKRCGVTSRAHLDHDENAARLFRAMRLEFDEWRSLKGAA